MSVLRKRSENSMRLRTIASKENKMSGKSIQGPGAIVEGDKRNQVWKKRNDKKRKAAKAAKQSRKQNRK